MNVTRNEKISNRITSDRDDSRPDTGSVLCRMNSILNFQLQHKFKIKSSMKSAISNRSSLGTSPNPPRFNASELIRLRNIKTPSDCLSSILPKTSSSYYGIQNNPSSSGVKNSRITPVSKFPGAMTPCKTPKSATSNSTEKESACILAVCEGRGHARGEVGLAALNMKRPHLILCQLSDGQSYVSTLTKINIFNPTEILIPHTFCDSRNQNKLFSCISDTFNNVMLTTVQRRHFNDMSGLTQIQHLSAPEYASVEILVQHKFYALAAAAALLKYVEYIQNMIFASKSLKVEYQGPQNATVIDVETSSRLELVQCLRGSRPHHSLLGILNRCHSGGGTRLLRANILQPPNLQVTILERLNCVQEIVDTPELLYALKNILPRFADIDRLLSICMHIPQQDTLKAAEIQINYVLLLKTILQELKNLQQTLKECRSTFLCSLREILDDQRYANILKRLMDTLHDDAHSAKGAVASLVQRSFAVKPEINALLDVSRKTYCEIIDDITTMVKELGDEYSLPLRVNYNMIRGFHIQMTANKNFCIDKLPPVFIQVQKSRTTFSFTTQVLVHADERAKDAFNEVLLLSNNVIFDLLVDVRKHISCLYKLCENVSELDMLTSLAILSATPGYVRPQFGKVMDVKNSRHPMLDFINPTEPVPNDIFASPEKNFHIITGPNMSGKSIYIRQVVLLQIMAQVGCYIPASAATFHLTDRIFSRTGFDDSIECNASTFVLEVREVQYILQTATSNSIIIMDELCRGTSSEEGTAMAWALCCELLKKKSFTFLTTHFLFLTKLANKYQTVVNHYFETVEVNGVLRYTHCLLDGVTQAEHYGLQLARRLAMPDSVVNRALELVDKLSNQETFSADNNDGKEELFQLVFDLKKLWTNNKLTIEECEKLKVNYSCLLDLVDTSIDMNINKGSADSGHKDSETQNYNTISNDILPELKIPNEGLYSKVVMNYAKCIELEPNTEIVNHELNTEKHEHVSEPSKYNTNMPSTSKSLKTYSKRISKEMAITKKELKTLSTLRRFPKNSSIIRSSVVKKVSSISKSHTKKQNLLPHVSEMEANGGFNTNEQQIHKTATEIQISHDEVQKSLNKTKDPISSNIISEKYQQSIENLTLLTKFDEVSITPANIYPKGTYSETIVGENLNTVHKSTVRRNLCELSLSQHSKDSSFCHDLDKTHSLAESCLITTKSDQSVEDPKMSKKGLTNNSDSVPNCNFKETPNTFCVYNSLEGNKLIQLQPVFEGSQGTESETEIELQCESVIEMLVANVVANNRSITYN